MSFKPPLKDKHGIPLTNNSIIDIHQTVNGCNEFLIQTYRGEVTRAFYFQDCVLGRQYEYDLNELVSSCEYSGEADWEVVGSVTEKRLVEELIDVNEKLHKELKELRKELQKQENTTDSSWVLSYMED